MQNIILIGMPGSGKSTLGIQLAKLLGMGFVDTDLLIQSSESELLYQILENKGFQALRQIEERILLGSEFKNQVIATGGSAVYSEPGMQKLKQEGRIILLDVSLEELLRRIGDYSQRGIASENSQSFADIFAERAPLYKKNADLILNCNNRSMAEILNELTEVLG